MCSTKIHKSEPTTKPTSNSGSLDTLGQVPHGLTKTSQSALKKRAIYKHITNEIIFPLIDLKSPLRDAYWNTFHCSTAITQNEGKLTSSYCDSRWCLVCERIRMAKAINSYLKPVQELEQLQFTTLTAPLVHVDDLRIELEARTKHWHNIKQTLQRQGIRVSGLFKAEAVLKVGGMVNLHFHILHDKGIGSRIINEWLLRVPEANIKAQDTRQATPDSLIEVVKYQTKAFSKERVGDEVTLLAGNPKDLDCLYQQIKGKRMLQPFGDLYNYDRGDNVEGIESEIQCAYEIVDRWMYTHIARTWVNENGEMLVETDGMQKVKVSFKSKDYGGRTKIRTEYKKGGKRVFTSSRRNKEETFDCVQVNRCNERHYPTVLNRTWVIEISLN